MEGDDGDNVEGVKPGTMDLLLTMLVVAVSSTKLALVELKETELADSDDSTLKTELVAVKEPVVMKGVVAAIDIVGVLERP